jgi:aspartate 1-decarboxylase
MQRIILRAEVRHAVIARHSVRLTGICEIDANLMETAGIGEFEAIHLRNVNSGECFSTYAIRSERKTGEVVFDEALPCKCKHGDFFIISTYRSSEAATLVPRGVGRFVMY